MVAIKDCRPKDLSRIIWFCWLQGLDEAPILVQKCYQSWVSRNPGWEVRLLDQDAVNDLTLIEFESGNLTALSYTQRTDLIRLKLLARYGGVWVDATCFCQQALDEWLPLNQASEFFAFSKPGRDRLISTWFMAATNDSQLPGLFYDALLGYWGGHRFRNKGHRMSIEIVSRILGVTRVTTRLWFTVPFRDWLRIAPYFAPHYIFNQLVNDNPIVREIWEESGKIGAKASHGIQDAGFLTRISPKLQNEIDQCSVPVYKLDWRISGDAITSDCSVGYLLGSI